MRHSTQEEKDDYEAMLNRKSTVLIASEEFERIKAENERLREAVTMAIKVQTVLCGDMGMSRCREECPLYRQETDDCLACDVIEAAREAGIEVV